MTTKEHKGFVKEVETTSTRIIDDVTGQEFYVIFVFMIVGPKDTDYWRMGFGTN